jgi:hypothetical protein
MTEYKMTSDTLVRVANLAGIPMTRLYDKSYFYLGLADWRRVLGESLRDMPEYCPDRRDCENLANISEQPDMRAICPEQHGYCNP